MGPPAQPQQLQQHPQHQQQYQQQLKHHQQLQQHHQHRQQLLEQQLCRLVVVAKCNKALNNCYTIYSVN
jgi:hypothetical protein